ncbi:Gamma-aminobutyric acid (GABA) B receptor [Seminavis robusta]|uniref:Gamma-aminobutyric acid (GABA) B receptor n=1 Tax=Seminavis robusta TaxID=568900 RepID=A0A9N8ENF9_9STRA|nr:Gamma-aminobutyric acid (GABA) B receptor [Seminavis robusta]|eukprot:Sro1624_g286700.1 Gamma-aminobutyric acid (GABA) B receptor (773) ;mRNA; f:16691-19102
MSFRDSEYSPLPASKEFLEAMDQGSEEAATLAPFAIVGAEYSSTSGYINSLASVYEIPMVSGSATSKSLDARPFFGRTIPTNKGDAFAAMTYYSALGITHVACIYDAGNWGRNYNADLRLAAQLRNITMLNIPIEGRDKADVEKAVIAFKNSGLHHVIAPMLLIHTYPTFQLGHDYGIMGASASGRYSWIFPEFSAMASPSYDFPKDADFDDIATAHNGVASLDLHLDKHEALEKALIEFTQNTALQKEFISMHHQPELFQNFTFSPLFNFKSYLYYDAVVALSLAACNTPGLFTGPEVYSQFLQTEFQGVSGLVQFDNQTGTRNFNTVQYRIDNILLSANRSTETHYRYDSHIAAIAGSKHVEFPEAFVYADGSTIVPPSIPPVHHEYNKISLWALILGWTMAGLVLLFSVLAMLWTAHNRNVFVVKAAQPVFILQLCVGTIVMACAVYPLSMQGEEPSPKLDRACMAFPWLFFCGFVIAFSAVLAKTWRANKLINSGRGMRRITINAQDVILPFVVLLTTNIALLTAWTVVSPYTYVIEDMLDYDSFGRSLESFGVCRSDHALAFLVPILIVNCCGVMAAAYQVYMARDLPTLFSESKALMLCVGSLIETWCLGGPILIVVWKDPTTHFVVLSALICITCLTILVPIIVPKYRARRRRENGARAAPAALLSVASTHSNIQGSSRLGGRILMGAGSSSLGGQNATRDNAVDRELMALANKQGLMAITRKPHAASLDGSDHSRRSNYSLHQPKASKVPLHHQKGSSRDSSCV